MPKDTERHFMLWVLSFAVLCEIVMMCVKQAEITFDLKTILIAVYSLPLLMIMLIILSIIPASIIMMIAKDKANKLIYIVITLALASAGLLAFMI